ncbi:MAG: acyltransferase [Chitinivibrionales bacterium]|nr:acyltransferase [Chitinivibrionales bacterium]
MLFNIYSRILRKLAFAVPGGYSIRPWLHKVRGVHVGEEVWISQYVYIDDIHPECVTIGNHCSIGLRTSIFAHFYWGPRRSHEHAGPVVIGDNVFIGPHCLILPNVTIGEGTVIQAGTVVSQDVPPGVMWGMPKPGPLASVTVPLTHNYSFLQFRKGLRPWRKGGPSRIVPVSDSKNESRVTGQSRF